MIIKKLKIAWQSDDYANVPSAVVLKFSKEEVGHILKLQQLVKLNNFQYASLRKQADKLIGEEWNVGEESLRIYADDIYYHAVNDNDSRDMIESQYFELNTKKTLKK